MKETEGRKAYRTTCEYHCDSMDPHRRPCNRYFCLNYNCQCTEFVRCPRMVWYDFEVLGLTEGLRCRHCSHAAPGNNGYIGFSHYCTLHHEDKDRNDKICKEFEYDAATEQTLDREFRYQLKFHTQNRPFEPDVKQPRKKKRP